MKVRAKIGDFEIEADTGMDCMDVAMMQSITGFIERMWKASRVADSPAKKKTALGSPYHLKRR